MSHPLLDAALTEASRARGLFPCADHLVLAFSEEAGEVVKACLDYHNKLDEGNWESLREEIRKELIQAVAMAIRLWDEGDPTLFLSWLGVKANGDPV